MLYLVRLQWGEKPYYYVACADNGEHAIALASRGRGHDSAGVMQWPQDVPIWLAPNGERRAVRLYSTRLALGAHIAASAQWARKASSRTVRGAIGACGVKGAPLRPIVVDGERERRRQRGRELMSSLREAERIDERERASA